MAVFESNKAKLNALVERFLGTDAFRAKSEDCFRAASQLDHIEAMFRTGEIMAKRARDRFDDTEALDRFRKAAERGHIEAQFRLGEWLYHNYEQLDSHDDEDPLGLLAEAIEWLRCTASRGHSRAQVFLVDPIHDNDSGIDADEAIRWLHKAAALKNGEAQYLLAQKLLDQEFGTEAVRPDPRDPMEAGREWLEKAAENGHREAQFRLAGLFEGHDDDAEIDVPAKRDLTIAAHWFAKAAEQGHAGAAQRLLSIRRAAGTPSFHERQDAEQAEAVFRDAEQMEHDHGPDSKSPNAEWAVTGFRLAARLGHSEGQFRLAQWYEKDGSSPSLVNLWYRKAAEQGHTLAAFNLARRVFDLGASKADSGCKATRFHEDALKWLAVAEKNPPADIIYLFEMRSMRVKLEAAIRKNDEDD